MMQQSISSRRHNFALYLRSAAFFAVMTMLTLVLAPVIVLLAWLPFPVRYRVANAWVGAVLKSLEKICGLRYRVEGLENIPKENGIVFCKHQSAWETIALQKIFPPQVFLLKRELLWLPFFGWALAALDPIAIDRKAKTSALRQVVRQGSERLERGRWVIIFPEGTRIAPGRKGAYGSGGAMLAQHTARAVVPVAHNAGEFWNRRGFLKRPGTIRVRIGPRIESNGLRAGEINRRAERWIESQMAEISGR